jgi:hypothetical protein
MGAILDEVVGRTPAPPVLFPERPAALPQPAPPGAKPLVHSQLFKCAALVNRGSKAEWAR